MTDTKVQNTAEVIGPKAPRYTAQSDLRWARLSEFWHYFSENKGAVVGLVTFCAVIVIAIFAPVFAPHDPSMQYREAFLVPPFWEDGGTTRFLLGTDAVGRDILSRLIYGSRYSLFEIGRAHV